MTGSSSRGQSSGSYSRSASWMSTSSPRALPDPGADRRPLAPVGRWVSTRTVESSRAESTLSVPSVEPSSTTITSTCIGSSHGPDAAQDLGHRVALVVHRDDHRQRAELDGRLVPRRRRGSPSRAGVTARRPVAATLVLGTRSSRRSRRRPSSSGTAGSHPSSRRAIVMSGRRRVGSSMGRGSCTMGDDDPVSSSTARASSRTVSSCRVADVDRAGERSSRAAPRCPPPRRRRSRGCASASRRRTP